MYYLQILTSEEIVLDDEVAALIAPGIDGYLGVLTDHAPLITSLKEGTLVVTDKNSKRSYYHVSGGFLEVDHNKASILVEKIEPTAPVDIGTMGGI